jgi:membrane protease YdiL (CAAX protease family)
MLDKIGGRDLLADGLANAIISLIIFAAMVSDVKYLQLTREKDYTPSAWVCIKKHDIKQLFLGIILALFYKLTVGFIETVNGTMIFTIDQSGIFDSLIATLASSVGFLGVALLEEGFFRGYLMQVILKRFPIFLAISIQAVIFGLIHYFHYLGHPYIWIEIADAILIGLIFGLIVIKTKSLMLVVGAHLMYNVAESIIFIDSHEFNRAIYFQPNNATLINSGSLLRLKSLELIILSAIFVLLVFLSRTEVLNKKGYSDTSC